jgi:hypothetical protein
MPLPTYENNYLSILIAFTCMYHLYVHILLVIRSYIMKYFQNIFTKFSWYWSCLKITISIYIYAIAAPSPQLHALMCYNYFSRGHIVNRLCKTLLGGYLYIIAFWMRVKRNGWSFHQNVIVSGITTVWLYHHRDGICYPCIKTHMLNCPQSQE